MKYLINLALKPITHKNVAKLKKVIKGGKKLGIKNFYFVVNLNIGRTSFSLKKTQKSLCLF
jgi:hypothetical protein